MTMATRLGLLKRLQAPRARPIDTLLYRVVNQAREGEERGARVYNRRASAILREHAAGGQVISTSPADAVVMGSPTHSLPPLSRARSSTRTGAREGPNSSSSRPPLPVIDPMHMVKRRTPRDVSSAVCTSEAVTLRRPRPMMPSKPLWGGRSRAAGCRASAARRHSRPPL